MPPTSQPIAQSSGIVAGTYPDPTTTVDAQGVVQAISPGQGCPVYVSTTPGTGTTGSVSCEGTGIGDLHITPITGRNILVEACGNDSRTGAAGGLFTLKKGSTTLLSASTTTSAAGSTTIAWQFRALLTFLSTTSVIGQAIVYHQGKFNKFVMTAATTVNSTSETMTLVWGTGTNINVFKTTYFAMYYE